MYESAGVEIEAMRSRPRLFPHVIPVWAMFMRLIKLRDNGLGTGCIPPSEIRAELAIFEVESGEDQRWFYNLVRQLDDRLKELETESRKAQEINDEDTRSDESEPIRPKKRPRKKPSANS